MMKSQELAKLLLEHPDFEVKAFCTDCTNCTPEHPYPEVTELLVCGIADIGWSDKVIVLDVE